MTTRNRLLKILAVASAVIIAVYFIAEIYGLTTRTYSTRTVYEQTVLETVDSEMFIVRDETLLNSNASGTFVQIAENGERVSRGSTIAAFFNNETAAHNYVKIDSLNSLLGVYQSIESQTRLENVDIEKLQNQTKNDFDDILDSVYNNDFSDFDELKLSYNESASKIMLKTYVDVYNEYGHSMNNASSQLEFIQNFSNQIKEATTGQSQDIVYAQIKYDSALGTKDTSEFYKNKRTHDDDDEPEV